MRTRLLIGLLGVAATAYGAWLLLAEDLPDLVDTAVWLAAGVVLHDFVLVPLTLTAGWIATRLLPPRLRAPVAAGLVVLGTLTLVAVPVLGGWGANADNPTILDRDYPRADWVVAAGIVVVVEAAIRAEEEVRCPRAVAPECEALPRDDVSGREQVRPPRLVRRVVAVPEQQQAQLVYRRQPTRCQRGQEVADDGDLGDQAGSVAGPDPGQVFGQPVGQEGDRPVLRRH